MATKDMYVFYKQKKNNNTIANKLIKKTTPKHTATFGSGITHTPALVSNGGSLDLKDSFDEEERVLRQFDMNMAYGPCLGITRLARWERAQKMGLNPLEEIESVLKDGKVKFECLFDGLV